MTRLRWGRHLAAAMVAAGSSAWAQPVPEVDRVEVVKLDEGFWQVTVHYGFKDEPDIPVALEMCAHYGLEFDMMDTSFFLGRETLIAGFGKEMSYWRVLIFSAMFRNASSLTAYLKIPSNRVVISGSSKS